MADRKPDSRTFSLSFVQARASPKQYVETTSAPNPTHTECGASEPPLRLLLQSERPPPPLFAAPPLCSLRLCVILFPCAAFRHAPSPYHPAATHPRAKLLPASRCKK